MLFFYYGEDSFRAKQKIDALVEKFSKQVARSQYDIEWLDGTNMSPDDFWRAVTTIGFLAEKKLVIIKDILANKKLADWQDALLKFLDKQKETPEENYIIFWQTNKPDARLKIFKRFSKFKYSEEFTPLYSAKLPAWIKQRADSHNKRISDSAVKLLINYVGNDLWQMSQEIHKLAHYNDVQEISETDVKDIVQAKIDDNIFALIDALGHKNKALALKLIEEKINSGMNHQYILTMVVRQFRLLIKAKSLESQLNGASALAQMLKIHPLVADKTWEQCRYYEAEQLKRIYAELLELDEKFKTSSGQEKILLTKMINKL